MSNEKGKEKKKPAKFTTVMEFKKNTKFFKAKEKPVLTLVESVEGYGKDSATFRRAALGTLTFDDEPKRKYDVIGITFDESASMSVESLILTDGAGHDVVFPSKYIIIYTWPHMAWTDWEDIYHSIKSGSSVVSEIIKRRKLTKSVEALFPK